MCKLNFDRDYNLRTHKVSIQKHQTKNSKQRTLSRKHWWTNRAFPLRIHSGMIWKDDGKMSLKHGRQKNQSLKTKLRTPSKKPLENLQRIALNISPWNDLDEWWIMPLDHRGGPLTQHINLYNPYSLNNEWDVKRQEWGTVGDPPFNWKHMQIWLWHLSHLMCNFMKLIRV